MVKPATSASSSCHSRLTFADAEACDSVLRDRVDRSLIERLRRLVELRLSHLGL